MMPTQRTSRLEHALDAFSALLAAPPAPPTLREDHRPDSDALAALDERFGELAEDDDPVASARALAARARLRLLIAREPNALEAAEQSARLALARLDCRRATEHALAAAVVLAEVLAERCRIVEPAQRTRVERARLALEPYEILALQADDALRLAELRGALSRIVGERYTGERDGNLIDAVMLGEAALPQLREAHRPESIRLPLLLLHLGNCCARIGIRHRDWLTRGQGFYREGMASVDAAAYPRLHRVLDGNAQMMAGLLAQDSRHDALPEMEMVSRFMAAMQDGVEADDRDGAEAQGRGFLRWAWSLDTAPNRHVAGAHLALARLAAAGERWPETQLQAYQAALVGHLLAARDPEMADLAAHAASLLRDALTATGRQSEFAAADRQVRRAGAEALAAWQAAVRSDGGAFIEAIEQCLARYPEFPPAWRLLAQRHYQAGSVTEAGEAARRCLALQPNDVDALVIRAVVATRDQDSGSARDAWGDVLAVAPDNAAALASRGRLLAQAGRWPEALADADRLVAGEPGLGAAYLLRADCREAVGDLDGALRDLAQARALIDDEAARSELDRRLRGLRTGCAPGDGRPPGGRT
ncbi:MAG: tetratricopeptide repeat protein [Rhodocyclaceae bacterium]|nr:tetratricopeptide repeat protein [Rhodocyclaceae bacterium]